MDPQPTEQKPSRTVIIVILAVLVVIAYALWPGQSSAPTVPTEETVSTSTTPTTSANPVTPTAPAPTTATPTSAAPKPTAPSSGDMLTASIQEGTVPFSTDFTLTLNSSRDCSTVTYLLDYGDNTRKEVQVPQSQCGKVYTTSLNHQYQRAGNFTATLSTKPVTGAGVVRARVDIKAKNPSVTIGNKSASFTVSPAAGASPLTVDFTLSTSDSADSSVRYTLVFGDGQSTPFPRTASPSLSHVYTSGGAFVVIVNKQTGCTAAQCTGSVSPVGTLSINVN